MGASGVSCLAALGVLLAVLLFGRLAVLSATYEHNPGRTLAPDSTEYDRLAEVIVDHNRFATFNGDRASPELIRTPGYPLFLAAVYRVFGKDRFPALVIQVVLSVLTFVPLYWIGSSLWSPQVGLTAAVIYALDYIALLGSQMLLSDSLYVFALMIALALGVAALLNDRRHRTLALLFGFALAIMTLIRPVSYYLIIPIAIAFGWVFWQRLGWKRALGLVTLILLPWLIIVGGWQARNHVVAGTSELSLIQGFNLMRYQGAYIIARRDNLSLYEAREVFNAEIENLAALNLVDKAEAYTDKAMELVKDYPHYAVAGQVRGTAQLMLVPGEADVLRYLGGNPPQSGAAGDVFRLSSRDYIEKWFVQNGMYFGAFLLAAGYLIFIYLGSGITVVNVIRGEADRAAKIFLIGVVLYFIAISGGPETYARLRMPVMPVLSLLAAAGWCHLLAGRRESAV